jgi:DNA-binding HxlR family transcriptional regulator
LVAPDSPDFGEELGFADGIPELSDRDAEIVQRIEREGLSAFTFDGLKRLTRAHPETLSRALERLEEQGMVVKTPTGYAITEKAKSLASPVPAYSDVGHVPLLHTLLPYDTDPRVFIEALKGKWFDRLRWVGESYTNDGIVLKWVTEDGAVQVDARFSPGQLDIDARAREGSELNSAVKAAHQLMNRISRLYSSARPGRRVAFARLDSSSPSSSPAAM